MTSFPNFQKKLGSGGVDRTARGGARILQTFSTYTYNIDSTVQQGMHLYRYMLFDTLATLGFKL